jgi:tRNA splicing endonuclease
VLLHLTSCDETLLSYETAVGHQPCERKHFKRGLLLTWPGFNSGAVVDVSDASMDNAAVGAPTIGNDSRQKPPETPVDVYLTGGGGSSRGAGYIWNAEDAFRVREEFRLLGDFVGTLPKHSAQNQYLALPLVLSYEEVAFGVASGFFSLLSDSPGADYVIKSSENAAAASQAFYAAREADFARQATAACAAQHAERTKQLARGDACKAKRPRSTMRGDDAGGANGEQTQSRKRRRNEGFVANRSDGDETDGDDSRTRKKARKIGDDSMFARLSVAVRAVLHRVLPLFVPDPMAPTPQEIAAKLAEAETAKAAAAERSAALREKSFAQARASAVSITPTESRPGERARSTLAAQIPAPIGISNQRLALRGAVFRDLYRKGYYMSCGAKFGADFLAYAGEPLLYHAALAVIVMHADDPVSAHDVVALGRLGDSTKKRTVLAFVNGDPFVSSNVGYVGVQWEESLP